MTTRPQRRPHEAAEREARRRGLVLPKDREIVRRIRATLFGAQLAPFDDRSSFVQCVCGRRAGKTTLSLAKLVCEALLHPRTRCIYVGLSQRWAKNNAWKHLKKLVKDFGVDLEKDPSDTETKVELANGSIIELGGVNSEKEQEKFRGGLLPMRIAVVDECGFWPQGTLETFVEEVIVPALMDVDGVLWLTSSPARVRRGYFFEVTNLTEWRHYHWTAWENPTIKDPDAYCAKMARGLGIEVGSPKFQREFKGIWMEDSEGAAYRFTEANLYGDALPTEDEKGVPYSSRLVCGVDPGVNDDFAIVVLAYSPTHHDIREVYSWKRSGLSPSQAVEKYMEVRGEFGGAFQATAWDSGGMGKAHAQELLVRYGLTVDPAEKRPGYKPAERAWMNADLRDGHFKVRKDSPLLDEWRELTVDEEGEEDDAAPNHLSDACLYAYQKVRHFRTRKEKPRKLEPVYHGPTEDVARALKERELRMGAEAAKRHERVLRAQRRRFTTRRRPDGLGLPTAW